MFVSQTRLSDAPNPARRRLSCLRVTAFAVVAVVIGLSMRAVAEDVAERPDTEEVAAQADASNDSAARIAELIALLGDDDYFTRERAQQELAGFGLEAYQQILEAAEDDDLEVATRARRLLRSLHVSWSDPSDPPQVRALLNDYGTREASERLQIIAELAALPRGEGAPALCRLASYELSETISRSAAIALLWSRPLANDVRHQPQWNRRRWAAIVRAHLPKVNKEHVRWVAAYLPIEQKFPPAAIAVDAFEKSITPFIRQTENQRDAPMPAGPEARGFLVEGDMRNLGQLDVVASDRAVAMSLLYMLANARREQGDSAKAEALAGKASGMLRENDLLGARARLVHVYRLRQRGCIDWAIDEAAIAIGRLPGPLELAVARMRSELLHDQLRDDEAAQARRALLDMDAVDEKPGTVMRPGKDGLLASERREYAARASYFEACHAERQGDQAAQRTALLRAVELDPNELDALIELYALDEQGKLDSPEENLGPQLADWIDAAAEHLRTKIAEEPENASWHNQLAWLLTNTDRAPDEARRAAETALKLAPDEAAFLDTMAHVCFNEGDLAAALEHQRKAVAVDPNSKILAATLARFEAAAESNNASPAASEETSSKETPAGRADR